MRQLSLKKTLETIAKNPSELTIAELRRKERICEIQYLLDQGYSAVYIKTLLKTSYNAIRRYKDGDPDLLCRWPDKPGSQSQALEFHREFIIQMLSEHCSKASIFKELVSRGYPLKRTSFNVFCNRLAQERGLQKATNTVGKPLNTVRQKRHTVNRRDILKYIWRGNGLAVEDIAAISEQYPLTAELKACVNEFNTIFDEHSEQLLLTFIDCYATSTHKHLKSFTKGLKTDIAAVTNAVLLQYSNGYLEGNNSRLKMIKRTMYGRAGLPLLRAKIIL